MAKDDHNKDTIPGEGTVTSNNTITNMDDEEQRNMDKYNSSRNEIRHIEEEENDFSKIIHEASDVPVKTNEAASVKKPARNKRLPARYRT